MKCGQNSEILPEKRKNARARPSATPSASGALEIPSTPSLRRTTCSNWTRHFATSSPPYRDPCDATKAEAALTAAREKADEFEAFVDAAAETEF